MGIVTTRRRIPGWAWPQDDWGMDPTRMACELFDFTQYTFSSEGWTSVGLGGTGGLDVGPDPSDFGSIFYGSSAAPINNGFGLRRHHRALEMGSQLRWWQARVWMDAIWQAEGIDPGRSFCGWSGDVPPTELDQIGFRQDDTSNRWQAYVVDAGAVTSVLVNVIVVPGQRYTLGFRVNALDDVDFFIDDVHVATIAVVPTDDIGNVHYGYRTVLGTNTINQHCDYVWQGGYRE